jgi:hypothetical protein
VRLIAQNVASPSKADKYVREVRMYVYEEEVEGRWVGGEGSGGSAGAAVDFWAARCSSGVQLPVLVLGWNMRPLPWRPPLPLAPHNLASRKLTELINERHENVKYMPGCHLGDNVVACADLLETVRWGGCRPACATLPRGLGAACAAAAQVPT